MEKKNRINVEWCKIFGEIISTFLNHMTLEYDGEKHEARINYLGPNGWKIFVNSSYKPAIEVEAHTSEEEVM